LERVSACVLLLQPLLLLLRACTALLLLLRLLLLRTPVLWLRRGVIPTYKVISVVTILLLRPTGPGGAAVGLDLL
jgi:hypothetical protein